MLPAPTIPRCLEAPARATVRRRAISNLLRMGHCAPAVMRTLLDATGADDPWLVKLAGALPGGIGNSGNECGGITAPLVLLGLRHAREPAVDGVPVAVSKGRALLEEFEGCHGTTACRDILGNARLPLRCIGVVRLAPGRCLDIDGRPCGSELAAGVRESCARLHAHWVERDFHCAHFVVREVLGVEAAHPALLDATSAFVGGTACAGLTCGALTAGVMLLGLTFAEIEQSPRRVLRMIATMAVRGDALADERNAFNHAVNLGHELARWFAAEFGSTQCRVVTGCDLSTLRGALRYIESDVVRRCQHVARLSAIRVREMIGPT